MRISFEVNGKDAAALKLIATLRDSTVEDAAHFVLSKTIDERGRAGNLMGLVLDLPEAQ